MSWTCNRLQGGHESKVATIWAWWMFMCKNKMLTKINESNTQMNYQRHCKTCYLLSNEGFMKIKYCPFIERDVVLFVL
jgi:hypothetical protein